MGERKLCARCGGVIVPVDWESILAERDKHIASMVSEMERLRAENARLRSYIAASANNVNVVGSAYDEAIRALDRLVAETKSSARAALTDTKADREDM